MNILLRQSGHAWTIPNADQCWSIKINLQELIPVWINTDHYLSIKINFTQRRSMPINANHCRSLLDQMSNTYASDPVLISIDHCWVKLIFIDLYWSAMIFIEPDFELPLIGIWDPVCPDQFMQNNSWKCFEIILCLKIGCDSKAEIPISHWLEKPGSSDRFLATSETWGKLNNWGGTWFYQGEKSSFSPSLQCPKWIEKGGTWFFKLMGDGIFHLRFSLYFKA